MRLTPQRKRRRQGDDENRRHNMLRRMSIGSASALEWVLEGYEDADQNREIESAEVFGVAGFASRPADNDRAEAIVGYLGGDPTAPVLLATRDADAVKAFEAAAGELGKGETAIFTSSGAHVHIDAAGNVHVIPSATGTVNLGARTLTPLDGAVNGQAVDIFTGQTQFALQNASGTTRVKK